MNKKGLEYLNGDSFDFDNIFTCTIYDGMVLLEQYSEGAHELKNIKTVSDYCKLRELLTGEKF